MSVIDPQMIKCVRDTDPQYIGDSVMNSQCVRVTDPQHIGDSVINSVLETLIHNILETV